MCDANMIQYIYYQNCISRFNKKNCAKNAKLLAIKHIMRLIFQTFENGILAKKKLASCETRYLLDMCVVYYSKLYVLLFMHHWLKFEKSAIFFKKFLICLNTNFSVNFEYPKIQYFLLYYIFLLFSPLYTMHCC